ncbi:MAG: class II aldolase/adducin family protein [Betaproteobacteria bacterium]
MTGPMHDEVALRLAVVSTARAMSVAGLTRGRSGNVSARWRSDRFDGLLITPTGMSYATMGPADVVALHRDGSLRDAGARIPSSEWRFHCEIYAARPDAGAIVHTHSPFATTLACLARGIPPFHYMVAAAGGHDIRCAPYARFGSAELAHAAVAALQERKACLLAHHGMIAIGDSAADALALAIEVEGLAQIYWRVLQIGEPVLLSTAEMQAVVDKFVTYGQQDTGDH